MHDTCLPNPSPDPITVLVVDDHPPIRQWVGAALRAVGMATIDAATGDEAIRIVIERQSGRRPLPHAAICDILMPGAQVEGIEAVRVLWGDYHIPCLMLTADEDDRTYLAAMYAGAFGYLRKRDVDRPEMVVDAVRALVHGQDIPGSRIGPVDLDDLARRMIAEARHAAVLNALTPMQRQVADLVVAGLTNREIGARLHLGRGTVNAHVSNILHRLGLTSRRDLRTLLPPRDGAPLPRPDAPRVAYASSGRSVRPLRLDDRLGDQDGEGAAAWTTKGAL